MAQLFKKHLLRSFLPIHSSAIPLDNLSLSLVNN